MFKSLRRVNEEKAAYVAHRNSKMSQVLLVIGMRDQPFTPRNSLCLKITE
jgi:hypothetical protein